MGTQTKREAFLNEMSRNGELKQVSLRRNRENMDNSRNRYKQERYVNKSKKINRTQKKSKAMRKRIGVLLAAGLVAFGSYSAKEYYDENLKSVTIEEALKSGKTLEELGLNSEIIEDLNEIKEDLSRKDELSKKEILNLGHDIENFELSIIHEKVANAVSIDGNITVHPRDVNGISTICIENEEEREIYNESDGLSGEYGKEIGDYIESISSIQNANEKYSDGQYDREEILEIYEKSIKQAERFASSRITENEKGNMEFDRTTKLEIKENKKEADRNIDEGR